MLSLSILSLPISVTCDRIIGKKKGRAPTFWRSPLLFLRKELNTQGGLHYLLVLLSLRGCIFPL